MKDLALAFLYMGLGLFFFSIACDMVRSFFRPKYGINYGMIINSETGEIKPQQRKVER